MLSDAYMRGIDEPQQGVAAAQSHPHPYPRTNILSLLACIALFALADFLVVPLMLIAGPGDVAAPLIFACFGTIGAQGGLHAIWFVLAPIAFRIRLAMAATVGLVWYLAWAVGYAVHGAMRPYQRDDFSTVVPIVFLCLPLLAIGIQAPLWLARIFYGWRILRPITAAAELGREEFGIRHIFVGMTFVGLALAAARFADAIPSRGGVLIPVAIASLVACLISLLTMLPLIVATLRAQRLWLALPVTLLVDTMVLVGFVVIVTLIDGRGPPWETIFYMASVVGGFFVSVTTVMLAVRRLGYRLMWGRTDE